MLRSIKLMSLAGSLLAASIALAQAPAAAPAGSTGVCRDGTYWTGATKKGACHGHKGVQDWYANSAAGATASTAAPTPSAASAPVAKPAATPAPATPAPAAAAPAQKANAPATTAAPGGGAGQVWVNANSKVYHCSTDRWYGKTKHGSYMSESEAIAQGNRADHGKACSK